MSESCVLLATSAAAAPAVAEAADRGCLGCRCRPCRGRGRRRQAAFDGTANLRLAGGVRAGGKPSRRDLSLSRARSHDCGPPALPEPRPGRPAAVSCPDKAPPVAATLTACVKAAAPACAVAEASAASATRVPAAASIPCSAIDVACTAATTVPCSSGF